MTWRAWISSWARTANDSLGSLCRRFGEPFRLSLMLVLGFLFTIALQPAGSEETSPLANCLAILLLARKSDGSYAAICGLVRTASVPGSSSESISLMVSLRCLVALRELIPRSSSSPERPDAIFPNASFTLPA